MDTEDPKGVAFSLVVPVRDEQDAIAAFHGQLTAAAENLADSYEIVYVDDGSGDQTGSVLRGLPAAGGAVHVVELSRPFGAAAAVTAGAAEAKGRAVITFDRRPDQWALSLPQMVSRWREGFEVVHVGGGLNAASPSTSMTIWQALRTAMCSNVGHRADMRLIDRKVLTAMSPGQAQATLDQRVGAVGFRHDRLPRSGSTRPLPCKDRQLSLAERPGRLFWWLLSVSGGLLGLSVLFYLLSLVLLAFGADTGGESRLTAVLVAVTALYLGLVAMLGRVAVVSAALLQRHPAYVVRSVTGIDRTSAAPTAPAEPRVPTFVVYT